MSRQATPIKKISTKIFDLGIKARDAEIELNKQQILIDQEVEKAKETASSVTDMHNRLEVGSSDYAEIEKQHLEELDSYIKKSRELKDQIEEESNTYSQLSRQNNHLLQEIQKNSKLEASLSDKVAHIDKKIESLTKELKSVLVELSSKKSEKEKELRDLNKLVSEEKGKLSNLKEDIRKRKVDIERETRILAIKKADLDIYLSRMKKKYPNEVFTLTE